jgi:anti-anti-sigma factor
MTLADHQSTDAARAPWPIVTVAIAGEFDMAREVELLEVAIELDVAASTVVRLDMSEVTFVDSAGLRGLLKALAYLEGRGSRLELLRPNDQLRRIIEITGLGDVVTVFSERP